MILGFLLLVCGLALIVAEVAVAFTGVPLALVAGLLALTGFTEYVVAREVWEDLRP